MKFDTLKSLSDEEIILKIINDNETNYYEFFTGGTIKKYWISALVY